VLYHFRLFGFNYHWFGLVNFLRTRKVLQLFLNDQLLGSLLDVVLTSLFILVVERRNMCFHEEGVDQTDVGLFVQPHTHALSLCLLSHFI